jgi:hypothetical protein
MKAKLHKMESGYILSLNGDIDDPYAIVNKELAEDYEWYKLSLKNCQAIELGYDLDLIKLEFIENTLKDLSEEDRLTYYPFAESDSETYVLGFQRAIEFIKNKEPHKDPKLIESMALRYRHDFGLITDENEKNIIRNKMCQLWEEVVGLGFYDGLNEWDVEIEMDPYYDGEFIDDGKTHIIEPKWKPRLDPNDCLILKRI